MAYKNKEDQAAASKRHYEANKQLVIDRALEFKIKRRVELHEHVAQLKNVPCKDCGLYYPHYVMDFDHTEDNKFDNISNMVIQTYSLERIEEEISKCDIVCSNCHRVRTYNRRNN